MGCVWMATRSLISFIHLYLDLNMASLWSNVPSAFSVSILR